MTNKPEDDKKEVYARADDLESRGTLAEQAVRFLNAEFHNCFYAVKRAVWMTYMENGREERRLVGHFF